MELTQEEFLKLFHSPRFRYIHDVTKQTIQGDDVLDTSYNERGFGVFFSVNGTNPVGAAKIADLQSLNCNYVDIDIKGVTQEERDSAIEMRLADARKAGVPEPTMIVRTKNGVHCYWMYKEPVYSLNSATIQAWRDVQETLIANLGGDKAAKDPTRVLRVPGAQHLKDPLDPFLVRVVFYEPKNTYSIQSLKESLPHTTEAPQQKVSAKELLVRGVPVGQGLRHAALAQVAGVFLKGADTAEKVAAARENYYNWDKKVVGSHDWESRIKELDDTFDSILKKEQSKSDKAQPQVISVNVVRWKDIDALEFPADRWRVKDLVPKAGAVILASVSGEGKTWVALEIARCVAEGLPLFGEERFATVKGKVLYVDAENGRNELQARGRKLGFSDSDNLLFFSADEANFNSDEWAIALKKLILTERIDLVIVDTFRAVAGKIQEEKAEEIRAFFNRFKDLKEYGVCMIWLDHFRKPDFPRGNSLPKKENLFGSQDKVASVEVLLMMKKNESDITVFQKKNRLDKEMPDFEINLSDTKLPNGELGISITYIGIANDETLKREEAKEHIVEILKNGACLTSQILKTLQSEQEIGNRNVRSALKELLESKTVKRTRKGREFEYSLPEAVDI